MKLKYIVSLLVLAVALNIHAQDTIERRAGILNAKEQSVGLATGIDYAIAPLQLNYKRGFTAFNYKFPVILGAEVSIPMFAFDLNDISIKITSETTILRKGNFEIRGGMNAVFVNAKLETETMSSLGADFHVFTGLTSKKWTAGFTFNYNQVFSTYIKHSDKYKDNVFADVVDGWYKNTAANIRIGLLLNRTFGKIDVHIKAGASLTAKFNEYLFVPPLYGLLGVSYRF